MGIHICDHDVSVGDYVRVRYETGKRFKGAILKGRITRVWGDGLVQAQVENGWCFHDHDTILEHVPQEDE